MQHVATKLFFIRGHLYPTIKNFRREQYRISLFSNQLGFHHHQTLPRMLHCLHSHCFNVLAVFDGNIFVIEFNVFFTSSSLSNFFTANIACIKLIHYFYLKWVTNSP